jgi:hypothetical protein
MNRAGLYCHRNLRLPTGFRSSIIGFPRSWTCYHPSYWIWQNLQWPYRAEKIFVFRRCGTFCHAIQAIRPGLEPYLTQIGISPWWAIPMTIMRRWSQIQIGSLTMMGWYLRPCCRRQVLLKNFRCQMIPGNYQSVSISPISQECSLQANIFYLWATK